MICSQCGHKQSEGMFCGLCGGKLIEQGPITEETDDTSDQAGEITESSPANESPIETSPVDENPVEPSPEVAVSSEYTEQQRDEQLSNAYEPEQNMATTEEEFEQQTPVQENLGPEQHTQTAEQQAIPESEINQAAQQQTGPVNQQPASEGQTSESFDKVVATSKQYSTFFRNFLRTPSNILANRTNQLTNAIINLVILAIVFTLAFYNSLKVDLDEYAYDTYDFFYYFGGFSDDLHDGIFSSFTFQAFLTISVSMFIVILVIFALNKFFGNENVTLINITSTYGVLMIPAVIVGVLGLIFALIKNFEFTNYLLITLFLLIVLIIPLYIVSFTVIKFRKNLDPIYAYLIYTVSSILALVIVNKVILESITGEFVTILFMKFSLFITSLFIS